VSDSDNAHDSPSQDIKSKWIWSDYLVVTGLALMTVYALLQLLLFKYGRDQGIYSLVAKAMVEGGSPYRDAWDFKPPGIYFVYALAHVLFGSHYYGIRLIEVVGLVAAIPCFVLIGRRYFGDSRVGIFGAALAILIESQLEFWHTSQPESFGGILTIFALAICTQQSLSCEKWRPRQWSLVAASGALIGAACLMKPHLIAALPVFSLAVSYRSSLPGKNVVRWLRPIAAMSVGLLVPMILCWAWFANKGTLGDLRETLFVFAPGYASTTFIWNYFHDFFYSALEDLVAMYSASILLGTLALLALPPAHHREREGAVVLTGVIVIHLAGIAIQSKFFPYHYGATLPLMALLAAVGINKLWLRARAFDVWGAAVFLAVMAVVVTCRSATRDLADSYWNRSERRTRAWLSGDGARQEVEDRALYSAADVNYGENLDISRWTTQHVAPSESVFLWGFEPFVYEEANRKSASRVIYNVPQRAAWEQEKARSMLMFDLARSNPRAIIVEHRDVFPVVTGNYDDSANALRTFPALRRLIDEQYQLDYSIGDFDLYLRR